MPSRSFPLRLTRFFVRGISLGLVLGLVAGVAAQSNEPSLLPPTSSLAHPTARVTLLTLRLPRPGLVPIPAGTYLSLEDAENIPVAAFWLAEAPVTNAEFLEFVRVHPSWQRSQVSRHFADSSYLAHWAGDLELGPAAPPQAPVVRVSWFSARAYAAAQGQRLPTTAEWEHAAAAEYDSAEGRAEDELSRGPPPSAVLPDVATARANRYGVRGLHGLVWEWVEDFNTAPVTGESCGDAGLDDNLRNDAELSGATDTKDSAVILRSAFRSSLKANTTSASLGFRCAQDQATSP